MREVGVRVHEAVLSVRKPAVSVHEGDLGVRKAARSVAESDLTVQESSLCLDAMSKPIPHGCAPPSTIAPDAGTKRPWTSFHTTLYLEELETEAMKPGPTVCPGVLATLDRLEGLGVVLGLGTGNYTGAARIKLARFGLWSRFPFGGFGDETRDRAEVIARAAREGMCRSGASPAEVVVIGDTPADIEAARAVGARVLAVATGPIPADELAAGRPDHLVPTLLAALRDGFWK